MKAAQMIKEKHDREQIRKFAHENRTRTKYPLKMITTQEESDEDQGETTLG
jgi:hypothetical protein